MSEQPEVVLAQDQGIRSRGSGVRKGVEAEFGIHQVEGTLVLTNKRLIFVCTGEREDDLMSESGLDPTGKVRLVFTDVEDVDQVPTGSPNIFIPFEAIRSVKGRGGGFERPTLEVRWDESGTERSTTFSEGMMGRRGRKLEDWAPVIENLKAGRQKLIPIPEAPSKDTLQGKIVQVLSDMQEKGILEIEEAVETQFSLDLEPDEIQSACDTLSDQGLLKKYPDPGGDVFYRKASALGEDDLSS